MNWWLIIELVSVLFNLVFLYLFIQEKKVSWIYGIIGSLTGAFVVYNSGLVSETVLYLFYAFMGVVAYTVWTVKSDQPFVIKKMKPWTVVFTVVSGFLVAFGLGYLTNKINAEKPFMDALSTSFGIIATFLEIYKYYIAWTFWILINLYSVVLYFTTGLFFYAGQMVLYSIMSVYGLLQWNKKMNAQ